MSPIVRAAGLEWRIDGFDTEAPQASECKVAVYMTSGPPPMVVRFSLSVVLAGQKDQVGKLDNETVAEFYEEQLGYAVEMAAKSENGYYSRIFKTGDPEVAKLGRGVIPIAT